jgi:hypothetical protein
MRRSFSLAPLLATVAVAVAGAASASACTTFTSDPEPGPAEAADSGVAEAAPSDAPVDAGAPDGVAVDAAPDVLVVPPGADVTDAATWASPNGATWAATAAGTTITGYTPNVANHPLLVLSTSSPLDPEDYTVSATILSPDIAAPTREFGIYVRGGAAGGIALGSQYGGASKPFLAAFEPPAWSPVTSNLGADYMYQPLARYKMKVTAKGALVTGKLWLASAPEPLEALTATAASAVARGVGFYTYLVNGAVLESFVVTSP